MDDIQIKSILSKSKQLENILDQDLAKKVLEIDHLASSHSNRKLLERVVGSLEQYIAKEQALVYVGFVGHFSSGKSTTINNLLELGGTRNERSTDLNPTDTDITLITDNQNSRKLFKMSREGGLVPVRTLFIESEFLENLVIADTPGSGDPKIANEMIQDFIPICDYILYFISSTNPVDQADLPLLEQKHLKLPFIPLTFVVTRADEFKVDGNKPVSMDNLDSVRRDGFIGQLISRLKNFAQAGEITEEDFLFIDNKSKFNLDQLAEKLFILSNQLDQKAMISNHGHKIEYFRRLLTGIESYFMSIIRDKLATSEEFLKTARENISKFDKTVELNNEKLKIIWMDASRALVRSLQVEQDFIDKVRSQFPLQDININQDLLVEKQQIGVLVENLANGHLGRLTADLYQSFRDVLIKARQDFQIIIRTTEDFGEDLSEIMPTRIDFSEVENSQDVDFTKLNEFTLRYLRTMERLAEIERSKLITKIDLIESQLSTLQLSNSVEQVYALGAETIKTNFEKFFTVIELYKGSVMTKNNKLTIEKLRVGKRLDELDDDFSEDFKSSNIQEAIETVYPNKDAKFIQLRKDIHPIEDDLREVKRAIMSAPIKSWQGQVQFEKETLKLSDVMGEVMLAIEDKFNLAYREKVSKLKEFHREDYLQYNSERQQQAKIRKFGIIKWGAIMAVLGLIICQMVLKLDFDTPPSVYVNIFMSIGTSAISYFLGRLIGKARFDVNKMLARHTSAFVERSRQRISEGLGEDFFNGLINTVADNRPKNLPSLQRIFMERFDTISNSASDDVNKFLREMATLNQNVNLALDQYYHLMEIFQSSFSGLFTDPDSNLSRISVITQRIKEKSIAPSFELLESTQLELERVCYEIDNTVDANSLDFAEA